jgi:hypothetical protein
VTRPQLIVLTGIAAATLAGWGGGDSGPEDTVNTFVDALAQGHTST